MVTMQNAIQKAVELIGESVLSDKQMLLRILEDLMPEGAIERQWIESLYTVELGEILIKASRVTFLEKPQYLKEANIYLTEKVGLVEARRKQFLNLFSSILVGHMVEVKKYRDYKPALAVLKKQYGKSLSQELIQVFVEENKLFARFSITLDDAIRDLETMEM